jgi:hypothetical protein
MCILRWFQFDAERKIMSLLNMVSAEENEDDTPSTDDR